LADVVAVTGRSRAALWPLAGLAAAVVVALARQPRALDTVWAEDGSQFLARADHQSLLHTWHVPYAGYLHVVPRAIASAVALLPTSAAAAGLSVAAAVVVAAIAAFVYVASAGYVRRRTARLVIAGSVLLVPVAQVDVLDNIANLHWFLMYGALWALLWSPHRMRAVASCCVVVAAAALSDPLTVLLAPAALVRLRESRELARNLPGLSLAVTVAVQLAVSAAGGASRSFHLMPPLRLPGWWGTEVVSPAVVGDRLAPDEHTQLDAALGTATLVLLVLVLLGAVAWRAGSARRRRSLGSAAVLAAYSLLAYAVPVTLAALQTPRYAVWPVLCLTAAVVVAADVAWDVPGVPRVTATAVIVVMAVGWVSSYRVDTPRTGAPGWSAALQRAESGCRAVPGATATVAIAPTGWSVRLPCRRVLEADR
jgi:hypothetical protein